jgi:signal transduction histidine kinase
MRDLVTQGETGLARALLNSTHERRRPVLVGLAGRLIALIAAFVMIAEVTIYIPAIANFRYTWIRHHLASVYTAALVLEAAPPGAARDNVAREVLHSVSARSIAVNRGGERVVLASGVLPDKVDEVYDLRDPSWFDMLDAAFRTLIAPDGRVLTFLGVAPRGGDAVELTMDEAPLKRAMHNFSQRVLFYSLTVSAIVGALVAFALHWMILRPVRRLTNSIVDFGADPSDRSRIIMPSRSSHEIGQAERALAVMQEALALEIAHKKNLANLGLAVAKINHDMRNMLASAQILSDRLANITDPLAQRLAPKLVATLDRAIRFCQATLTYGRAADEPPRPRTLLLHNVVAEAAETVVPLAHGAAEIRNEVPPGFEVTADAEQMFRILMNLMRNGVEALERAGPAPGRLPVVRVRAWRESAFTVIEVADTGPGVPLAIRPKIFTAFQNSSRPGGSGLGLAIVADLIRAHGGTIELRSDADDGGATFKIVMPWLPALAG